MRPAAPAPGNVAMFDKRTDLVRFLAVADTGKIAATAERLAITQPTLTRDIARLEHRFGGKLFERLPHGVRLTALGGAVAERARRVLRELQAADEAVDAVGAGRTGVVRVSATPPWAETVLAPAAARFHHAFPHIELRLDTTTRAEGLRRLADGATDLHCGGIDGDEPPAGVPAPRTLPRHDRGRRRLERPSAPWREGHPPRPLALPVDRLRLVGDRVTR